MDSLTRSAISQIDRKNAAQAIREKADKIVNDCHKLPNPDAIHPRVVTAVAKNLLLRGEVCNRDGFIYTVTAKSLGAGVYELTLTKK